MKQNFLPIRFDRGQKYYSAPKLRYQDRWNIRSAQQNLDKYLAMARKAIIAGDRVIAEGFFQHADHYYRIVREYRNGRFDIK